MGCCNSSGCPRWMRNLPTLHRLLANHSIDSSRLTLYGLKYKERDEILCIEVWDDGSVVDAGWLTTINPTVHRLRGTNRESRWIALATCHDGKIVFHACDKDLENTKVLYDRCFEAGDACFLVDKAVTDNMWRLHNHLSGGKHLMSTRPVDSIPSPAANQGQL